MEHPFQQTDDTDLQVKLHNGTILYLETIILSCATDGSFVADFESDEVITNDSDPSYKTLNLTRYHCSDVIQFFKHLYPQQNVKFTSYTNFKALLDLSSKFKVDWLREKIQRYLIQNEFISGNKSIYQSSFRTLSRDPSPNLLPKITRYLSLAQEFKLKNLKNKMEDALINMFDCSQSTSANDEIFGTVAHYDLRGVHEAFERKMMKYSFPGRDEDTSSGLEPDAIRKTSLDQRSYLNFLIIAECYHYDNLKSLLLEEGNCLIKTWIQYSEMEYLSQSTLFEIVKSIIFRWAFESASSKVIVKVLDHIYVNLQNPYKKAIGGFTTFSTAVQLQLPKKCQTEMLPLQNRFVFTKTTDVQVSVGETTLHLHSSILCYSSPVFKAMLSESFKEGRTKTISLPNKDVPSVIEFFEFFYVDKEKQLEVTSNFMELLTLCEEYQVLWLRDKIEDFLVENFDVHNNIEQYLISWKLHERFEDLVKLKTKIYDAKPSKKLDELVEEKIFGELRHTTKYQIIRRYLVFDKITVKHICYKMKGKEKEVQKGLDESEKRLLKFLDEIFIYGRGRIF